MTTIGQLSAYIQQRLRDEDMRSVSASQASLWVLEAKLLPEGHPLGNLPVLHILQTLSVVGLIGLFPGAKATPANVSTSADGRRYRAAARYLVYRL